MEDSQQVVELYENQCCVCFRAFWQKRRGRLRRTCSAACRQELYKMRRGKIKMGNDKKKTAAARHVKGEGVWMVCPVCGGPMSQPERGRKRRTCSGKCRKRLWRQENPRCLVCRKRFKRTKGQKVHMYCSPSCKNQARKMRWRYQKLEEAWAEMAGYRPDWLPRRGSGYREEEVPWKGENEKEAVIREREPEPNYEGGAAGYGAARSEAEMMAEMAAQTAEAEEAARQAREGRRLAWELLEDESKWWGW